MKRLLVLSLTVNLALVVGVFWLRARHAAQLHDLTMAMMRSDETYIELLDRSLTALEAPQSDHAQETAELLEQLVSTGQRNKEARRRVGLGDELDRGRGGDVDSTEKR